MKRLVIFVCCITQLYAENIQADLSLCSLNLPVSQALIGAYHEIVAKGNNLKSYNAWLKSKGYVNDYISRVKHFEEWANHASLNMYDSKALFGLNVYQRAIILSTSYSSGCSSLMNIGNMAAAISLGSIDGVVPQTLINACNAVTSGLDNLERAVESMSCADGGWGGTVENAYHALQAAQDTLNHLSQYFTPPNLSLPLRYATPHLAPPSLDLSLKPNPEYINLSLADLLNMSLKQTALQQNNLNKVYRALSSEASNNSDKYIKAL